MNLRALALGAGGKLRMALVQPLLHCGRAQPVGLPDRLVRREAPELEGVPHGPDRQLQAGLGLNPLRDGLSVPQGKPQLRWSGVWSQIMRRILACAAADSGRPAPSAPTTRTARPPHAGSSRVPEVSLPAGGARWAPPAAGFVRLSCPCHEGKPGTEKVK